MYGRVATKRPREPDKHAAPRLAGPNGPREAAALLASARMPDRPVRHCSDASSVILYPNWAAISSRWPDQLLNVIGLSVFLRFSGHQEVEMGKWSLVKHLRLLPDCTEKRFEASKLQERSYQWHLVVSCNYSSNEPPNDSHIDSSSNTKAIKPLLSSCVFILRIIVHTWKCYYKMSIDK